MIFRECSNFANTQNQRYPRPQPKLWRFDTKSLNLLCHFFYSATLFWPDSTLYQHDPCEEYIEGLTAQPWWDASQFEWVAGLEVGDFFDTKFPAVSFKTNTGNRSIIRLCVRAVETRFVGTWRVLVLIFMCSHFRRSQVWSLKNWRQF